MNKELEKLGLNKNEVKIYLALLELGSVTSGKIKKKTGVSISSIYYTLSSLMEKGLVSATSTSSGKCFRATEVKHLLIWAEEKRDLAKKILPKLKLIKNEQTDLIKTYVHESYSSIKAVYNQLLGDLKKGEEYYVLGARQIGEPSNEFLHSFFINFHKRREKKGIKVKIIFDEDLKKEILHVSKNFKLMEYRFIEGISSSFILVYSNKVINFLLKEKLMAVELVNKETAIFYKRLFEKIWKTAIK